MAFRSNKILPNFNGVGAGQTATLDVPIGSTYHQVAFEIAGVTPAQLTNFKVLLNGIPHIELPSVEILNTLNKFDGRLNSAGVFVLDFERFGLLTRQARELTAIGTGMGDADPNQVRTFQIQMDIDAAATSPSIKATATTSPASMSGLVRKIRLFNRNPTGAGLFEVSDLPKGDMINKVFFHAAASSDIDALSVEIDNYVKFERSAALNSDIQQSDGVRMPAPTMFVFDPTELGYGAEVVDTVYPEGTPRAGQNVSDLRFKLRMAGAQAQLLIVEYLGAVER
ncbi:double jelly roll capsid protein [Vibrio phage 1.020.O._10N.222.48.A2]|uniref:Double jelly roll capsid protein n=1 Tax=Vibrio phage 1.020.O._10N.222.48.A2 TaxID=1881450 RepID=A0A2I7QKY3_9VIRU|nr:major head protein [Vibrio phage 1.020.O._10N.222.48.A2]AUR82054.1 double jelly roll capsid protein [Vibrio phage 1.020.O._10N.222.48.A2]